MAGRAGDLKRPSLIPHGRRRFGQNYFVTRMPFFVTHFFPLSYINHLFQQDPFWHAIR
jgi:hypothetical protein